MLVNERGHTKLFYELFYYNMTGIPGPACYKIYSGLHLIFNAQVFCGENVPHLVLSEVRFKIKMLFYELFYYNITGTPGHVCYKIYSR